MRENTMEPGGHSQANQVEIWYCPGCKVVHLGLGDTRISFDRDKFSQFAEMVADVHYESFSRFGDFDLLQAARAIEVEPAKQLKGN